jgi:hypothetical protein
MFPKGLVESRWKIESNTPKTRVDVSEGLDEGLDETYTPKTPLSNFKPNF